MKKSGRFLAGLSAVMMALGASSSVYAAEIKSDAAGSNSGGLTGSGAVEGVVNTDIIKVILPTNNLNFKVDPQGLIAKTGAAKFKASMAPAPTTEGGTTPASAPAPTFMKGTVAATADDKGMIYFTAKAVQDSKTKKYTEFELNNTINLVVENRSSIDVYVKPAIKVVAPAGINLVKSAALATATDTPSIALSLSTKSGTTVAKIEADTSGTAAEGAAVKMAGIPLAYSYGYRAATSTAPAAYTYMLDDTKLQSESNTKGIVPTTLTYTLTGACNTTSAWSKATALKPSVNVTWTISKTAPTATK